VLGKFLLIDNAFMFRKDDPKRERLAVVAKQKGMLLMICDHPDIQRGLATGEAGNAKSANLVDGVSVGYLPDLYEALEPNPLDLVISL